MYIFGAKTDSVDKNLSICARPPISEITVLLEINCQNELISTHLFTKHSTELSTDVHYTKCGMHLHFTQ